METHIQNQLYKLIYETEYGNRFQVLQEIANTLRKKLNWTPIIKQQTQETQQIQKILDMLIDPIKIEELLKYIIEDMIIYLNEIYNLPTLIEDEMSDKPKIQNNIIHQLKKYGTNN
jgi:SAM-dependent MidA family methyltransferase